MQNDWARNYLGIPFIEGGREKSGLDCWGLVRLVYRDLLKIELPALDGYDSLRDIEALDAEHAKAKPDWFQVRQRVAFDVAYFDKFARARHHVALVLGNKTILHARRGSDSCIEPIGPYLNLLSGYYRHNAHRVVWPL